MNKETLDNIAEPVLHRAGAASYSCARGYAGWDKLPVVIGRIIAVGALVASMAAVRVNHSKQGPVSLVKASTKLLQGFVQGDRPQIATPAGLLAKGGS